MVELLLSITILGLIFSITAGILQTTQETWHRTRSTSSQFREARLAFETLTDRISQANLDPYWDYEFAAGGAEPKDYVKESHLHFVSGPVNVITPAIGNSQTHAVYFQAPFGQSSRAGYEEAENLLNAWGYGIEFGTDRPEMPSFVSSGGVVAERYRFRLHEYREDAENLTIYNGTFGNWYQKSLPSEILADNIIALVILPISSNDADLDDLSPEYRYDSRIHGNGAAPAQSARWEHELPPLLRITMVAVDESTVARLQGASPTALSALQIPTSRFEAADQYEADLAWLEGELINAGVGFRVFSSTISIRNSKWSEQ